MGKKLFKNLGTEFRRVGLGLIVALIIALLSIAPIDKALGITLNNIWDVLWLVARLLLVAILAVGVLQTIGFFFTWLGKDETPLIILTQIPRDYGQFISINVHNNNQEQSIYCTAMPNRIFFWREDAKKSPFWEDVTEKLNSEKKPFSWGKGSDSPEIEIKPNSDGITNIAKFESGITFTFYGSEPSFWAGRYKIDINFVYRTNKNDSHHKIKPITVYTDIALSKKMGVLYELGISQFKDKASETPVEQPLQPVANTVLIDTPFHLQEPNVYRFTIRNEGKKKIIGCHAKIDVTTLEKNLAGGVAFLPHPPNYMYPNNVLWKTKSINGNVDLIPGDPNYLDVLELGREHFRFLFDGDKPLLKGQFEPKNKDTDNNEWLPKGHYFLEITLFGENADGSPFIEKNPFRLHLMVSGNNNVVFPTNGGKPYIENNLPETSCMMSIRKLSSGENIDVNWEY